MIYVGRLTLEQAQNRSVEMVRYEGDTYGLNDYESARLTGYWGYCGCGRNVFFKLPKDWGKGDGFKVQVEPCPICGNMPVLKKRNGRKRLLCLEESSEKDHYLINFCGNGGCTSVRKAIARWNKRCFEISHYGVGFTDWRIQHFEEGIKEVMSVVQTSADRYSGGDDIVCDVCPTDVPEQRQRIAELICRAPGMRNAGDAVRSEIKKCIAIISRECEGNDGKRYLQIETWKLRTIQRALQRCDKRLMDAIEGELPKEFEGKQFQS